MKRCPECGNKKFLVSAHVVQEWLVDENESFDKCLDDCVEVTHKPDDDDLWICYTCGYEASGKKFNYNK